MKRKAAFFITSIFSILLLLNCKKDKTGNNPPPEDPIGLKVKILEYGSGIPLPDVTLTLSKCVQAGKYGCDSFGSLKNWTSGSDGSINISVYDYANRDASYTAFETNHWKKVESRLFDSVINPIFDTIIHKPSYDSAVIRLYPFATVYFRFKNVNSYGAQQWIRTYMEAQPENKAAFSIDPPFIDLKRANNFDITFGTKIYGNVKNRLICELLDSNLTFIKKVFDETKFVNKSVSSSTDWNVFY